ncbi:MAG TPA: hypothetical protein VMS94_06155 [Acidobacteriota bacterium]|nr:hypothetical protein [Acidobacteriota bacterium]
MEKSKKIILLSILFTFSCLIPHCCADTYRSYELLDHPGGSIHYRLNVVVQQSLYDYYVTKSHALYSSDDFAKFVTPYALKPIADRLWEIYTDYEDFANAVLMIVHQIPYEVTVPPKYPVETLVESRGDCDIFSYAAASILKAGGLNVVLLYYESQSHMNIAVSLPHVPQDARGQVYYVTVNGTQYYMAETTGDDWENGWRVGECPDSLRNAPVQIITLENSEQSTFGQVSASYQNLASSSISLAISPTFLIQGSVVTITGQLSPALQNETIVIYIRTSSLPWRVLGEANTTNGGNYAFAWSAETGDICYIRASWSGNENYSVADSPIQTVTILSTFFIALLGITAVLACVGIVVFLLSRQSRSAVQEVQPPEMPSV